jgi:protein-tyrosine-phosphatase
MANIVRSFMAERILRKKLETKKRKGVIVSSAGLIDMDNMEADPIAASVLDDHGIESSNHHSHLLTEEMVADSDMIIVMENIHRKMIVDQYPDVAGKISLLKSFSPDYNEAFGEIRDPYKLSMYHYRLCFSEIYLSIDGLMKCI